MEHLGIRSEEDYYDRLLGVASRVVEAELRNLLNLVTITETCFFRDASQFRLLRDHIIPSLMACPERSRGGCRERQIRIWSAGCSSGEEAYSIAMTLDDMGLYLAYPDWTIEIIGTDLNTNVLDKARRAVYSLRAVRNVEGKLLDKYFKRNGEGFQLREELASRVRFEVGNLTQTPMPSTGLQDIVFCKNVTIYFRSDVTRKLVRGLYDTLTPGGYLLLGHAESLWQMSDGFALVEHERAFCYRKQSIKKHDGVSGFSRTVTPQDFPIEPKVRLKPDTTYAAPNAGADATGRYDACVSAFRAGDWATAEASLTSLIHACPTFVPAYLLLGGVYAHRARYDEAAAQAEEILRLTDLEPRAHLLLGMIASRRQRGDEALVSLRRALYLDDSLVLAHFWLGNLYRERGDIARACQEYEHVVRAWERHTFELTEEFASDLTAQQLVQFCSESLERLQHAQPHG